MNEDTELEMDLPITVSTITFETNETEDEVIERVTNDPNVKRMMSGDE